MHVPFDWNRLDAAAYRVSMTRSVRWMGWWFTAIGVFVLVIGVVGRIVPFVAVGLVLAAVGAWNVRRPAVPGMLVDGLAMILTGAFQCLAGMWLEGSSATSIGKGAITGAFQILWGIRRLALYRTARLAVNDEQAIARLEATVHGLSKRELKSDPTVAEFRTGGVRKHRNRLGLYPDGVVALLEHQVVRLERRTDIWIEPRGTTSLGQTIKVKVQMGDLELLGERPTEHFERFESWKHGHAHAGRIAA